MALSKLNNYANDDTNILEMQQTEDASFIGKHQVSLTEMTTTTVPAIAAGSIIEVNGSLLRADTEQSISTTDPVTSSTVADGTVYIMIDGTNKTAYFTATAPTWSDSKQGWYGTSTYANWRYVEFTALKSATSYTDKLFFSNLRQYGLFDFAAEQSTTSGALIKVPGTDFTIVMRAGFPVLVSYSFKAYNTGGGGAVSISDGTSYFGTSNILNSVTPSYAPGITLYGTAYNDYQGTAIIFPLLTETFKNLYVAYARPSSGTLYIKDIKITYSAIIK